MSTLTSFFSSFLSTTYADSEEEVKKEEEEEEPEDVRLQLFNEPKRNEDQLTFLCP